MSHFLTIEPGAWLHAHLWHPFLANMPAGLKQQVLSMGKLDAEERKAWITAPIFKPVVDLFTEFKVEDKSQAAGD